MQTYDEPAPGWTLVLRRQPVHLVEGRPEGGYTDAHGQHDRLQHEQPPIPAASGTRKRTGYADGTTR